MDNIPREFISEIMKLGVISYSEQKTLWQIAGKCAKHIGVPMGAGTALMAMKAGSVTIPLGPIGGAITMSGTMAGFLAGLFTGTAVCTMANTTYRTQFQKLLGELEGKTIR